MTASALLDSLLNDAHRNGKPEVAAALQLLREPVRELELDRDLLDWQTENGASVVRGSQPDMGGRDWQCSVAGLRLRERKRSAREALLSAREALGEIT